MKNLKKFSKSKQKLIVNTLNLLRVNNIDISERSVKIPDEERYIYYYLTTGIFKYNETIIPFDVFTFLLNNGFIEYKNMCNSIFYQEKFLRYKYKKTI